MEGLSSYSQYLELIAAIIGIIKYRHFKHSKLKYVLFFIWYVVFNEFFAGICYPVFKIPNYIPYNIYYLVHFSFFIWWYSTLMFAGIRKNILIFLIAAFALFWLINVIFLQDFDYEIATYSYTLGAVFITIAVCFYFVEMLNRDVVLNITRSPFFWVSFGLLIYCVTYLPFEIALSFMVKENFLIWTTVLFLINSIQYGCFAVAFVKSDRSYTEHSLDK